MYDGPRGDRLRGGRRRGRPGFALPAFLVGRPGGGSVPSGETFLASCRPGKAGGLVIDLRMPGMSAFEVQREMAARAINLPMIFITGYGDVEPGVRAMKAGAVDFIQKPFREQDLLEIVQKSIAQSITILNKDAAFEETRQNFDRLTPREREVLDCIVAGEPNKPTFPR